MPAISPKVREHIYSCPICEESALPLRICGGFRNIPLSKEDLEESVELKIYKCDSCQSIFVSVNGSFFKGRFEDIITY